MISIMPPGVVHCVWSTEACLARGGHFLSGMTLLDTVAANMMFKRTVLPPTNAFHNSVLQVVVARRALLIIQRWETELQMYCRRRDRVRWARDTEELPRSPDDDLVTHPDGKACEWFALLFLVRTIAPAKLDSDNDRLSYTHDHLQAAILKTVIFIEFWTKRTRSVKFARSIERAVGELMCYGRMTKSEVHELPTFWRPQAGEDFPPNLEDHSALQNQSG